MSASQRELFSVSLLESYMIKKATGEGLNKKHSAEKALRDAKCAVVASLNCRQLQGHCSLAYLISFCGSPGERFFISTTTNGCRRY